MQYKRVHTGSESHALVFFNGWGMDWRPFQHLSSQETAVFIVYDYRDFVLPASLVDTLSDYRRYDIVAWSFGVWVCAYTAAQLPGEATHCIAVAGSVCPIDDIYGISPKIVNATLARFSPAARDKFYRRMCGDKATYTRFLSCAPQRKVAEQKEELHILTTAMRATTVRGNIFTHALVCTRDTTIPGRRQARVWRKHCPFTHLDAAHFPFFLWNTWHTLLEYDSKN